MKFKGLSIAALVLSGLLVLNGCGTSAPASSSGNTNNSTSEQPKQLTSITIAQTSNALGWAADTIAQKEGFFEKEGIKANIQIMSNGDAATIPAVSSGGAQFGAATTLSTLQAIGKGQKFKIIAPFTDQYVVQFVISKSAAQRLGITPSMSMEEKIKKIKGLKVGTLDVGGSLHLLFNGLVKRYGLNPNKDFTITAIHPYDSLLQALKRGQIDVALVVIPYGNIAVDGGYADMLADFWKGDVPGFAGAMHQSLFVSEKYASEHPEVVEAVRRAIGEALAFIHDHPDQTLKDLQETFPNTDPNIIKEIVVTDVDGYPKDASVPKDGFNMIRDFVAQSNPDVANVKYEDAVWPSAQVK
jgi:NitT/TauT family transport system substrate-binding protein